MTRVRLHGAQFALGALLAFTLWTYVSFTENPTETREIRSRVTVQGLGKGLLVVDGRTKLPEPISATTLVTVMGPELDIDNLNEENVRSTANLAGLGPGSHQIPITVSVPASVRVRSREPEMLPVVLARELVTTVPVEIRQEGQTPFSFTAGEPEPAVSEATVSGPEERVRQVARVVATVDLQGQTRDIRATLPLEAVDAKGDGVRGVAVTPEEVRVQVPIVAQVDVQQVSIVPNLQGEPAAGFAVDRIDWEPKIVEVFTTGGVTATLATEPITLTGVTSSITRTVGLAPRGNVITRTPNVEVTVRVSIVPIVVQSQLPLFIPVGHTNLGGDLNVAADPSYVRLTLAGPFEQLSALAADEITATVDLDGLGPGSYTLPVEIEFPDGLSLIEPSNPTVQVAIWSEAPLPTPRPTAPPEETTPGVSTTDVPADATPSSSGVETPP